MSHLHAICVALAISFVFSNISVIDTAPQYGGFANANAQASAGRIGGGYGPGFDHRRYGLRGGYNQGGFGTGGGYNQRGFGPGGGYNQGGFGPGGGYNQGGFGPGGQRGFGQGGSLSISKSISISRGGVAQSSSNAGASGK